jgi:hypothetical protein
VRRWRTPSRRQASAWIVERYAEPLSVRIARGADAVAREEDARPQPSRARARTRGWTVRGWTRGAPTPRGHSSSRACVAATLRVPPIPLVPLGREASSARARAHAQIEPRARADRAMWAYRPRRSVSRVPSDRDAPLASSRRAARVGRRTVQTLHRLGSRLGETTGCRGRNGSPDRGRGL